MSGGASGLVSKCGHAGRGKWYKGYISSKENSPTSCLFFQRHLATKANLLQNSRDSFFRLGWENWHKSLPCLLNVSCPRNIDYWTVRSPCKGQKKGGEAEKKGWISVWQRKGRRVGKGTSKWIRSQFKVMAVDSAIRKTIYIHLSWKFKTLLSRLVTDLHSKIRFSFCNLTIDEE